MPLQSIGSGSGLNQQALSSRTWYSSLMLATLYAKTRLLPYAMRENIPNRAGQTIEFVKYAKLASATTALTEGAPPAGTNLVKTAVQAAVAQYGDFIAWTDKFVDTSPHPEVEKAKELQGGQISQTVDTLIQLELLNGTNVSYGGGQSARNAITASDVITSSLLDSVIENIKNRHVDTVTQFIPGTPAQTTTTGLPAYIAFVNPSQTTRLRAISGFDSVEKYAQATPILPGEVGKYRDLRFVETTNSLIISGAGAGGIDVHFIPVIGMDAYGVSGIGEGSVESVDRAPGTAEKGNELGQSGSVGWKTYFVCKILDNDKIERIEVAK